MRDFGMEACQLVLALPDLHDPERSRNQELRGNLSETIVFWRLSARSLLAPSGLSHSSVPPRAELLKHVYANRSMQTERFSCPQDSLQTFEVSSISAYPGLQFWQDRRSPAFGESAFGQPGEAFTNADVIRRTTRCTALYLVCGFGNAVTGEPMIIDKLKSP
jgi:hypothetical protein